MARETVIQTVLSNGLEIRLKQQPYQRIVNLGVYVHHGTQNEDYNSSGLAHYIEHVLFSPTNVNNYAQKLLNPLLDAGATYEAYTSKEYTRYLITCLPDYIEQAIKLLGVIIEKYEVREEAIAHERPIILHEHAMAFSSSQILGQLLDNALWGDRSLGLFVIGRKQNIQRFNKQDIEERVRLYYVPQRTSLVALGPIEINPFIDMVARHFQSWKNVNHNYIEPDVITEPRIASLPTSSQRVDLLFGYLGVTSLSSDRHAMALLADILGGGMKSRLFLELREKRQMVYFVQAYPVHYGRGGYISIRVNCNRDEIDEINLGIQHELESIKEGTLTEAELSRVKAARITALLGVLGNSAQHLKLMGKRAILSDNFFVDREVRGIYRVQLEDIVRIARNIFVQNNVAVVGLGPGEEELFRLI